MNVLIVGRTKMSGSSRCIGGILENNQSVRLISPNGQWNTSCNFDVGDIWDIEYDSIHNLKHPHTEDILVKSREYVGKQSSLSGNINSRMQVWQGPLNQTFDGNLGFTGNNNGYISQSSGVTAYSTWFWIPDKDLTLRSDGKHYDYPGLFYSSKGMKYVGEPAAIPVISAGTLTRLSLARWWKPDDVDVEERCYLQLSGWF